MLLMGPDKLPEVAHRLGASWRALKRLQERVEAEVREAIPDLPSTAEIARMARSPVNLLNQLADRVDAKEALRPRARVRDGTGGGSDALAVNVAAACHAASPVESARARPTPRSTSLAWRRVRRAETGMTLAEHLAELRHRFLVMAITVFVFGVLAFIFYTQFLKICKIPTARREPGSLQVPGDEPARRARRFA